MKASGGCLCGELRYEIDGEPMWAGKCYCGDCRKETGGGHLSAVAVSADILTVTGESKVFSRAGDSGSDVNRTFCPTCGSTVFGNPSVMGDMRIVRLGTLDDSTGIEMQMAVYCSRAQDWDKVPEGLTAFPEMPPQG